MKIYVDAKASRQGNGSKEMPFKHINDAAQVAVAGDEVLGAAGTEVFVAGNGFAGGGVPCDLLVAAQYEKDALAACSPAFAVCMEEEGEGMLSVSAAGDLQILLKSDIITVKGRNVRYEIRTV